MRFFDQVGKMALGTRVRFLGEKIGLDAREIYKTYGVALEPKWFPVFFVLSKDASRSITSIAEEVGHSHVSVSKIVTEMSRAGLLIERGDPKDGRRTVVSLSAAGKRAAQKFKAQALDVSAAVEELLSQARHDLWAALEEWEGLLEKKSLLARVLEKKMSREGLELKVEDYEPKYREAFRKLNEEWITKYFRMEKPDRDALENPKEYILDRGGAILIVTLAGKPVGVCALIKRDDRRYPYELAKMAVSPKVRGKGVGSFLGQAVIDKARELGAPRLFLESNTKLKPAMALYQKLGFRRIQGPPTPYARCNIQMELELQR